MEIVGKFHAYLCLFTADVTPPRLTFIRNPRYSNAAVFISWRYNEEATSSCTLQTPERLFVIACDRNVSLTGLSEGSHTLYIVATDIAGNVARTIRHSWIVGELIKSLIVRNALHLGCQYIVPLT